MSELKAGLLWHWLRLNMLIIVLVVVVVLHCTPELRAIDTAELFEALRTGALRRTQESISLLLRAYAEQKQFDEAMQLVQLVEQSGGELQSQDYTSLLTLCGNVNNPGAAEQLIDLMRHRGGLLGWCLACTMALTVCVGRAARPAT